MAHILFPLTRLLFSQTATRLGIDNRLPPELMENAERLSWFLGRLDDAVFDKFGARMSLSSGYRCPALNSHPLIGGASNSAHVQACAGDTEVVHVRPYDLAVFYLSWLTANKVDFEQIIIEFGAWVHVSIPVAGKSGRKLLTTAIRTPLGNGRNRTDYTSGLQDFK